MNITEQLISKLDQGAISKVAESIGVRSDQAQTAASAAIPLLLAGLQRNVSQPGGAESLDRALQKDHMSFGIDDIGDLLGSGGTRDGGAILGHVFGKRKQNVEKGVASVAGIDARSAAQLLATLAPVIMGALAKAKSERNAGANELPDILRRESEVANQREPGGSGLVNILLDADGDGDVDMSDIIKRGGSLLGGLFK